MSDIKSRRHWATINAKRPELISTLFLGAKKYDEITSLLRESLDADPNIDDETIFARMEERIVPEKIPAEEWLNMLYGRAKKRAAELAEFLGKTTVGPCKRYLDVGSGNNVLTECIGTALKLAPTEIFAVDVKDDYFNEQDRVGKCEFAYFDGKTLGFPDNHFNVVTSMHVLHHVADDDLDELLATLHRVMMPGGVLLLREHDLADEINELIVELRHIFWSVVLEKQLTYQDFIGSYRSRLRPRNEWRELLAKAGFEVEGQSSIPQGPNLSSNYDELFLKAR